MTDHTAAPRFTAYLQRIEGRPFFLMPRAQWIEISPLIGSPVPIVVSETPMALVAQRASVVAAVAVRYTAPQAEIHIWRYDVKDSPTPYNLDRYAVWEDLPSSRAYPDIVAAASTTDDHNLRAFLRDTVFISKLDPGPGHWQASLPSSVVAAIKST